MQRMPGARPQDGRAIALQQERDRLERYRQLGIDGYDSPSFTDQFTAPINDEIAWASGYGMQGAENLARNLTGRPVEVSALDRARAMRQISNEGQDQFVEDYPVQAFTGGVIGGAAMAPARGAAIPGLIGRLGTEAGLGAAYGAAEGDSLADRLSGAGFGAGVGLALGGAAEFAAPYIGRLVNRVRGRGGSEALDVPALTNQTEAEAALARYRAVNPDDTGARVLNPGDEGYPTNALYEEASQTYVAPVENALTDYGVAAPEVVPNALSTGGTRRKGALNDAFASASNYDEALKLAQQGVHLRQGPDGQYVGAPRDIAGDGSLQVDSPEKLEEMRGRYDDHMRTGGGYGADWYDRARQSLADISDSPEMASFASRASSAYSPQATPDTEWNNFINQHNAKMVRGEDFKPMTVRQMENVASGYGDGIGQNSGQYYFQPENVKLGKKTGAYSDAKDPGIDRSGKFKSANDLWHGRVTGYSQAGGGNFNRAFTPAEHGLLTGENLLATQRAIEAGILPPGAGVEAMQAALWVEGRIRAYTAEQTARFEAGLRPNLPTLEEARQYAGTGIVEGINRSTGALSREFTPGGGLGELENVGRDPALNAQFSAAMGAVGGPKNDVFSALQMYQNPTTQSLGFWNDPVEGLQINPAFTDRPLVGTMPETITLRNGNVVRAGPAMSPFGKQAMEVAGRLHGYENMQHGVGANMFIPRNSSHRAQQVNGLRVTGGDPATIAEAARLRGLDAVDVGDAVLLTSFTGGQTNKQIQQSGNMLADELGVNVSPGRFDANYVESGLSSYVDDQITPTPQGQGIATQQLLDETARIPQFDQRMDATNYAQNVAARNLIRQETAAAGGGALRPDAERARALLAQGGVGALREYVKRFGLEGLPAWVGPLVVGGAVTLSQADQDQQQVY